jgi:L-alanine-DL-glutamate epimerase-like enolase superfamily enzyme
MKITRKGFLRAVAGGGMASGLGALMPVSLFAAAQAEKKRRPTITSVEAAPFSVPLHSEAKVALGVAVTADNVLIRLRTTDGTIGYGEVSAYSPVMSETQASDLALARPLGSLLLGRDPFELPRLLDAMTRTSPRSAGIIAAFEMALWDLCGKIAGQPVYRLLGVAKESFETDCTVFLGSPEEMARLAVGLAGEGFPAVKIKLGEAPALDIDRVRAIREAVGPKVRLWCDANQGWSVSDALVALRGIGPYGLEFCEQPVQAWDWNGLHRVRADSPIPIMADEAVHSPHDAIEGLRHDAFDMINIKLMKAGGILPAVRIAHIAAAANVPCMVGCMAETRLALTAAAHVVMSQAIIRWADLDAYHEMTVDPCSGGMKVERGVVTLPDTPGLGVEMDPAIVKKLKAVA